MAHSGHDNMKDGMEEGVPMVMYFHQSNNEVFLIRGGTRKSYAFMCVGAFFVSMVHVVLQVLHTVSRIEYRTTPPPLGQQLPMNLFRSTIRFIYVSFVTLSVLMYLDTNTTSKRINAPNQRIQST
ncbi:hypothetical protein PROFUN_04807 [Planoprotostelium fungivorum]|uniref:Uncharacterized protein n=1 Tax=Planoprotostelium fungivorum TaxID=1890364 RepID=A0A2P6NT03_9EUKA|nr:hypothetical protein PROFUN_04807 [Planoprotostelium fungivorum]